MINAPAPISLRQRINSGTDYDRRLREQRAAEWAAGLDKGALVVDAGAGDGHLSRIFPAQRYIGVDVRPTASSVPMVCADLHQLPMAGDSVDHVLSLEVFEHLERPAVALQELARILRPGGTVCLSVPQGGAEHEQPHDYYRFTRFSLAKMAQEAGLEVERIENKGGYFRRLSSELRDLPFVVLPEDQQYRTPRLASVLRAGLVGTFTVSLCTLLTWMDSLDRTDCYTTGYFCVFRKSRAK